MMTFERTRSRGALCALATLSACAPMMSPAVIADGSAIEAMVDGHAERDAAPVDASPTDAVADGAVDVVADSAVDAAPPRGTIEVIAGSGSTGFLDGVGDAARFSGPSGAALIDGGRTIVVADTFNALLRTIDAATGAVRTVAGRTQVQSVVDGVGDAARFQSPRAMVASSDGATIYLADGPTVRRVDTRSWAVTTLAGTAGMAGYVDGSGATTRLGFLLHSFALSADERTLYIADRSNRVLRTLDVSAAPMTGEVRTIAGARYTGADVHADGIGPAVRFSGLGGILREGDTLYVVDTFNHVLRAVDLRTMEVRTLAGRVGAAGVEDGAATEATFDAPQSLTSDGAALYVTSFQGLLRRVSLTDLRTTTVLGVYDEVFSRDGDSMSARLGVAFGPPLFDRARSLLFFSDRDASSFRAVDSRTYTIHTLAGAKDVGFVRDGVAAQARFDGATDLAVTADGSTAYVVDGGGRTVRAIDLRAGVVRTLAGSSGAAMSVDGAVGIARFGAPSGLALDESGARLFVSDARFHVLRAIDLRAGTVQTLAGDATSSAGSVDGVGAAARFSGPTRLCVIGSTLYVADSGNRSLRSVQIDTGAVATVLAGGAVVASMDGALSVARVRAVSGLACDAAARRVYLSDASGHTVRVVDLEAQTLRTIAGRDGTSGPADGPAADALFRGPRGLALSARGDALIVADQGNHSVRRVDLGTMTVQTILGNPARSGGLVYGRAFAIRDATLYSPTALSRVGRDLLLLGEDALYLARPEDAL